jgi:hypothetical protein
MRAGVQDVFFPESFTGLDSQEVTISKILTQKGYPTGGWSSRKMAFGGCFNCMIAPFIKRKKPQN